MRNAEMPFNWANVRAYVDGTKFPYRERFFSDVVADAFDCALVINSRETMVSIRDWLQDEIVGTYEKFGLFTLKRDERKGMQTKCVGVRFAFTTELDLSYFKMCCFTGEPVYSD